MANTSAQTKPKLETFDEFMARAKELVTARLHETLLHPSHPAWERLYKHAQAVGENVQDADIIGTEKAGDMEAARGDVRRRGDETNDGQNDGDNDTGDDDPIVELMRLLAANAPTEGSVSDDDLDC